MTERPPIQVLYSVGEIARILRVNPRTVRAMIADGRLRVIRPRGLDVVRIPRRALVAVLGRDVLDQLPLEVTPAEDPGPR
jgi:excisionase family DNA binding protein